jgi:hypothetical protein
MAKKIKVKKENLKAFIDELNARMAQAKTFYNIEVREHKSDDGCVWLLIG